MLGLSLVADYIGLAAIVGAFLAGLVVAELKQHTEVEQKLTPLAWFFVPFFFVSSAPTWTSARSSTAPCSSPWSC